MTAEPDYETVKIMRTTYNEFLRNTEILARAGRMAGVAKVLNDIEREMEKEKTHAHN